MNENMNGYLELLKNAGMRATPQRIAICQEVFGTDSHPSANQIFNNLKQTYPSLSLMTVYNTLSKLVESGVVKQLGNIGDDNAHYDGNIQPHINFVCVACHSIIDIMEQKCSSEQLAAMIPDGYKIIGSSLMVYGLCPNCHSKEKEKK
jgi:Fur family peroxide stress response transcriptional regulator